MSLEHYKTQVLLLHSQQSTLDSLSTGFNDRYTVHCATSGTEALNTLVETPIHVIVSAHDLPGMSGLDALREARKRSPDTIGILLAGTDKQDGLEALVGDKEVFQIVRGEITPDALRDLIDNATKRVRLMALSESANDQAANVDEPIAEHIVMETSENGSAIISGGTGRMPILKPQKIQIAPDAGGRGVDVLVLTKDEEFLVTIRDSSRGLHNVHHATTPMQAEEIAKNQKVGVLVTDAAMVGSNIEVLTQRLRVVVPRLVAVVAGRRDDGEMLMDLINRGQVYRFLLKPVSPGRARLAIEASVKYHLEAADSVFKQKPGKAAKPAPQKAPPRAPAPKAKPKPAPATATRPVAKPVAKPAARPAPKAAPNPAPAPKAKAKAKRKPKPKAKPAQARVAPRKAPTISSTPLDEPPDHGLDDAFSDGGSFTETMTGIVTSFGKSISGATDAPKMKDVPVAAASGGGASLAKNPRVLAAAGLVVVLAAGATWYFGGDSETASSADSGLSAGQSSTNSAASDSGIDLSTQSATMNSQGVPVESLLADARQARDAGQLIAPRGRNAVEYLVAARDTAPDDTTVAAEIDAVIGQVFGIAESALLENRSDDAAAALAMVRLATPTNPRLAFLEAQLAQSQLRLALDQSRAAIRENRFEDAATFLRRAESLATGDMTEINRLNEELTVARSEQRVGDVLSLAAQRLNENSLTSPANDNARYYYQLALNNDSQNRAAQQGLVIVASKLVLRAREAIGSGRYTDAEDILTDARALDPSSDELAASTRALDAARQADTEAARQAQAARQAEIDRRAAAEREAQRLAAEQEAERETAARVAAATGAAALAAGASGSTATSTGAAPQGSAAQTAGTQSTTTDNTGTAAESAPADAGNTDSSARSGVSQAPDATNPDTTLLAAAAAARTTLDLDSGLNSGAARPVADSAPPVAAEPEMVGISALTRINYVSPKYPRNAMRRNVTGRVDVGFTVGVDGIVYNIEIIDSTPGSVFNDSAIDAVTQWEFEPVIENGRAVEKRTAVRLGFDLQ